MANEIRLREPALLTCLPKSRRKGNLRTRRRSKKPRLKDEGPKPGKAVSCRRPEEKHSESGVDGSQAICSWEQPPEGRRGGGTRIRKGSIRSAEGVEEEKR